MSDWDSGAASGWETAKWDDGNLESFNSNDTAPLSERDPNTDQPVFDNIGGGNDETCRNCGQEGHFARECTEPKKVTGECFNCGQVGHNKADCQNPRVERPFTGKCRICDEEGHLAAECPKREPLICRNCLQEGHRASDCTQARVLDYSRVATMDIDAAWKLLQKASDERDFDDFKDAVKIYAKANREVTYAELEKSFMDAGFQIHLIAIEKPMPTTMTNVDLQGKSDKKFSIGYYRDFKPPRAMFSEGWPESAEDNLERLKEAGEPMTHNEPVCRICNERGHISKRCKQAPEEFIEEQPAVKCANCGEIGHRIRDCHMEFVNHDACKNCKQSGHRAADCPEPRSAENIECKICSQMGHFAKDCPSKGDSGSGGVRMCRNCGEEGHIAKECEKPRNPMTVTCRNCDEVGHFSKDCPKPRDYSRVKCSQCGEMGHTYKRCTKQPDTNGDTNSGFDNGGFTNNENKPIQSSGSSWENSAPTPAAGGWNDSSASGW